MQLLLYTPYGNVKSPLNTESILFLQNNECSISSYFVSIKNDIVSVFSSSKYFKKIFTKLCIFSSVLIYLTGIWAMHAKPSAIYYSSVTLNWYLVEKFLFIWGKKFSEIISEWKGSTDRQHAHPEMIVMKHILSVVTAYPLALSRGAW